MIAKKHTYGVVNKISNYFFLMMSIVSVVIGLFFLFGAINWFVAGKEVTISSVLFVIGLLFACMVWSPVAFVFIAYLSTDIEVDKDGMCLPFLWKKFIVKWGDFTEIKPLRPLGLFTNKSSYVVFVDSELTFVHSVYGLLYGGKYHPAFLIHKNINDYHVLIKNISAQVRKNRKS